jgi:hypothetical protein
LDRVWILTDSERSVRAIRNMERARQAQGILKRISECLEYLYSAVTIAWIPSHVGIAGNKKADEEARDTTTPGRKPTQDPAVRVRELKHVRKRIQRETGQQPPTRDTSIQGRFTWQLDEALPGPHAPQLYYSLNSAQAAILVQCRTNHTYLNSYTYRIKQRDSPQCDCSKGEETIQHVLFHCLQWKEERQRLKEHLGKK